MTRRTAGRVRRLAVTLAVTVGVLGACRARTVPRPVPPALDGASALEVASADSSAVRRALLRNIRQFQSAWRLAWQRSEVSRHGALQLALVREDISMGINSPEVARFRAIRCSAGFTGDGVLAMEQSNAPTGDFRTDTRTARSAVVERMRQGARAMEAISQQAQRAERNARDKSTVCAGWTPDTDYVPLDESDHPDLALMTALRPRLRRDRDTLLSRLAVAARRFPNDAWITGQRVRFALDQQDTAQAMQAVRLCRGDDAWCSALHGIVHERRGDLVQADAVFARAVALRRARANSDCSDSLLVFVLDDASRQRLANLPCAPRRALIDTLWWLADPLWSARGNERFVAHHARETWIRLRAAATEDERYTWRSEGGGEALRATIMRYGWPSHAYWGGRFLDEEISQARESVRMEANPPYLAHEYSRGRNAFIPDASILFKPFDSAASAWDGHQAPATSTGQWWPREHMRHRTGVASMPQGQLVLLRRDTAILVAIAIDSAMPERAPDPIEAPAATLLASTGPDHLRTLARVGHAADSTLRLSGYVRALPFVLAVEIESRVPHEPWHRLRHGVRPPAALSALTEADVAVSDPVLVQLPRRGATASAHPDTMLRQMRGSLSVRRDAPVALYWESYGFAPGDSVNVEIRIARRDENGALRSIGAALGLADARRDSIRIAWQEPDPGRQSVALATRVPTISRAIAVDLRNLAAGSYVFAVVMSRTDGATARGERRVLIVE